MKDSEDSPPLPRPTRKIRFLDPTEADIHVYESQPSSPKRTLGLLPPLSEAQDEHGVSSLGTFKGSMLQQNPSELPSSQSSTQAVVDMPEEGTPEDIRRRFFPSEVPPEDNRALTWMLPSPTPTPSSKSIPPKNSDNTSNKDFVDTASIEPRYSLSGMRLSAFQIRNLPTHLGLHHHASSSLDTPAGYTLSDLLLLARSSVPAQRASILGILAKILRITREESHGNGHTANWEASPSEQFVDMEAMRRDALDAAIDALGEKGGVGQRAVDLLWEAVVGFTYTDFDLTDLDELPCVDLTPKSPSKSSSTSQLSMPNERIPTKFSLYSSGILAALPLTRILPALKSHLVTSPSPLSLTHSRVLDVLFVLSHFSQHARAIVSSDAGVIAAMLGPHLQLPDSDSDSEEQQSCGTTSSIRVLQVLARCGRDIATTLIGPADALLRYIMTPLQPLDLAQWQSHGPAPLLKLLTETLVFYTLLAQYGIYANVATMAQNEFTQIGTWLLTTFRVVVDPAIACLACAYLKLLEALTVCATDPHMTTPSHDILWSQVCGWGWIEWTLDFTDVVVAASESVVSPFSAGRDIWDEPKRHHLWTAIFHTLACWVESASVNGVKRGEEERRVVSTRVGPLFESGHTAELIVLDAITRLQVWKLPSSTILLLEALRDLADAAGLLAAATRFALASLWSEGGWSWKFPGQCIHNVCIRFMENEATQELFSFIIGYHDTMKIPEDAHTFVRAVSSLLFLELQLQHRSINLSASNLTMDKVTPLKEWVTQALCVLRTLLPGDEHYAKWIFDSLCDDIDSNFVEEILLSANLPHEQWNKGGMRILLPFLTRSLRPKFPTGEDVNLWRAVPYIAPISPTPESTAYCTTLLIPSLSYLRDARKLHEQDLVLPMRSEWPTWPLNHLLRSGSSPVFHELPPNWDATETEVVRASLLLARVVQELCGKRISHFAPSLDMSRAETIFTCMKVFMLEHEQQQLDSGEEVFRDLLVTRWMDELLIPFAYANSHEIHQPATESGSFLEQISEAFLSTPFFQFYTDFLALYDAISFSHPLFARLLLPPISMTYAVDYRRLLFGDYGHAIRTIKTNVGELLCGDVREYLWPVEKDAQMLGWYFKALLMSLAGDFIRWIAVHHLALNIWPDFQDGNEGNSERPGKLLNAIMRQGSFDVIRDIAFYRQLKDEVWVPPKCYRQIDGDWVGRRLEFVKHMGDQRVKEQLHRLFTEI